MKLEQTKDGLALTDGKNTLICDFSEVLGRCKGPNLKSELIVKAASLKGRDEITVLDATAGLGTDSFLLAYAGFTVKLFESDGMIAALLRDGIERALKDPRLSEAAKRLELFEEDSIAAMLSGRFLPDVVYLDPMFPGRTKSALVKKKFQLLQQLEAPCDNGTELLSAAMKTGAKRIIIKRPAKGECLGGVKPDFSYEGKTVRYDCINVNFSRKMPI
jgi:16S rRNA (guanine1516-N2)-methyltransferase